MLNWIFIRYWARKLVGSDQSHELQWASEKLAAYGVPGVRHLRSALDRASDKPYSGWDCFIRRSAVVAAYVAVGDAAVPLLLELLDSGKSGAKKAAIRALGLINNGSSTDALLSELANEHLRDDAAWALGRLNCKRAAKPLMELWHAGHRSEAILQSLCAINDPMSGDVLVEALNYSKNPTSVLEALRNFKSPQVLEAIASKTRDYFASLDHYKFDGNADSVRFIVSAIKHLGECEDGSFAEQLTVYLGSPTAVIRAAAREALTKMAPLDDHVYRLCVEHAFGKSDILKILLVDKQRAACAIAPLLKEAERNPHHRAEILTELGWTPSNAEEKAWLLCAQRRYAEAAQLGEDAIPAFEAAITKFWWWDFNVSTQRSEAILAISAIKEPFVLKFLGRLVLSQKHLPNVVAALKGFGRDSVPYLCQALPKASTRGEVEVVQKREIIDALSEIGDLEAVPLLLKELRQRERDACVPAAAAISKIGVEMTDDVDRVYFAIALHDYDELLQLSQYAVPILVEMFQKPGNDLLCFVPTLLTLIGSNSAGFAEDSLETLASIPDLTSHRLVEDIGPGWDSLKDEWSTISLSVVREAAQTVLNNRRKGTTES